MVDHFDAAPESAADGLDALEPSVRQTGFGRGMAWVHAARAEVALSLGALDVAHHRAVQALRNATESGGIEDEGRAHIVLGRLALLEGRDADAASHLAEATPGLRGGGAQAIQHSDAHAGAAVLASGLETLGYRSTPSGATMTKRFSRFVRAVPVAKTRLEHIADLHAAADRRPRSLHRL